MEIHEFINFGQEESLFCLAVVYNLLVVDLLYRLFTLNLELLYTGYFSF